MIPVRHDKSEPQYNRSTNKLNPDDDLAVADDVVAPIAQNSTKREECKLQFENEYEEFVYEERKRRQEIEIEAPEESSDFTPQPRAGPSHSSRSKYIHFDDITQPIMRSSSSRGRRSRSQSRSVSPTKRVRRPRSLINDKRAHGDGPNDDIVDDEDEIEETDEGWKVRLDHILVAIGFAFMIGMTTFVFISGGRQRGSIQFNQFNPCQYDSCIDKDNTFCVPNGYDEFFSCQCIIDHHQDSNGNCVRNNPSPAILTGPARRKIPKERIIRPSIPMYTDKRT